MGLYASTFREDGLPVVSSFTRPSKADWITAHATATGLAVVEVERLWLRFQQLGCNKEGFLTSDVLLRPPASSDIFIKNIVTTFRKDDGNIAFQTFLNAMKWAETTTMEHKIRGIFCLLNNGEPVTKDILIKVFKRTYPDDTEEERMKIVDVFMMQIDDADQGAINVDQFVRWIKSMPYDSISPLLEFNIVPHDINVEAHRAFTSHSRATGLPSRASFSHQIPTDAILLQVAQRVHNRDWQYLANRLGFTSATCAEYERRNPGETEEQTFEMLKGWRSREGSRAYVEKLEKALRESGMNDTALLLFP
ncbi:hypothetical protein CAPTEDRAFT_225193 [Capitella teleta]|uniref:Death domain-containing protein n=1 Tax=Capitella teleta TaxID=283909 RepID=R7VKJ4_CAPTE|nr:hypothetical protein CAPTEDRAFT_225193 [Capitella teleta]|eukprot:ELU16815.1 hypothetical protein CAPTEDRAFT_225193 [Capitella teleta]